MKIYKNCPNCGAPLNDLGRCEYCNSKIYDFCDIDIDNRKKTYLRIKYQNQIIIAQVYASPAISIRCETDSCSVIEAEFTVLEATIESEVQEC